MIVINTKIKGTNRNVMIELNEKTKQDFLNRAWVQRLLDEGVDMSDAKYCICSLTIGSPVKSGENIQVALKEELPWIKDMPGHLPALQYNWACPTYTVSELLYKLHEWAKKHAEIKQKGGILMYTGPNVEWIAGEVFDTFSKCAGYQDSYYIKYLAALLIECHRKDIGMTTKDTGDISNK